MEHGASLSQSPNPVRFAAPTIGVLVAGRRSLVRVIDHLLRESYRIEVVGRVEDGSLLAGRARCLSPDLILAHPRVLGKEPAARIAAVRTSSPGSKLVLISSFVGLAPELRRCGADAFLEEDALVTRLLPTLQALATRGHRASPA